MKNVLIKNLVLKLRLMIEPVMLFIVAGYIMGLWQFLRKVCIANFHCGNIRPLRLYAILIPLIYIFIKRIRNKNFIAPHLTVFITMILAYVCLEYLPFRGTEEHYFAFFLWQIEIYVLFLILCNFGFRKETLLRIVNYSIVSWFVVIGISYLGIVGFLPVGFNAFGVGIGRRFDHLGGANMVSYKCAFIFILLMIRQGLYKQWKKIDFFKVFILSLSLVLLVNILGTRGAFIIFTFLYGAYAVIFLRKHSKNMTFIFLALGLLILSYSLFWGSVGKGNFENIAFVRRTVHIRFTDSKNLRRINLQNSFKNFIEHPLIGVGYKQAAQRNETGTRSNCQYTQLPAAWGIFFFLIYLFYNYKMLIGDKRLVLRDEIILMLIFWSLFLIFRRPRYIFAISAYIAAFCKYYLPNKKE
ncbi:O-antigen ligase family protein [Candidatus Omnitrophota bacterium]